jgi:phage tail-like protein
MTRPLDSDPLRAFRFQVTISHPGIPGLPRLGFMGVSGLAVDTEAVPYREGGNNTTIRSMPGQTEFQAVTFTRGCMAKSIGSGGAGLSEIWQWFRQVFAVINGGGDGTLGVDFRQTVNVDVLAHPVTKGNNAVQMRYQFYNAWPAGMAWSDLDAGANAVFVESLKIAHEGFDVQPLGKPVPVP